MKINSLTANIEGIDSNQDTDIFFVADDNSDKFFISDKLQTLENLNWADVSASFKLDSPTSEIRIEVKTSERSLDSFTLLAKDLLDYLKLPDGMTTHMSLTELQNDFTLKMDVKNDKDARKDRLHELKTRMESLRAQHERQQKRCKHLNLKVKALLNKRHIDLLTEWGVLEEDPLFKGPSVKKAKELMRKIVKTDDESVRKRIEDKHLHRQVKPLETYDETEEMSPVKK